MDALMQQRLEDLRTAILESHNIEVVQHHISGLLELTPHVASVLADAVEHERNLRKRTTRLPLGID